MHETSKTSYDEVPYESFPIPLAQPDRLATLARLAGLKPAALETCRVLELGCAAGGNLIPMAIELPGAQFVGVDLSAVQVAEGDAVIRALGLGNVRLIGSSLTDLDDSLDRFDYVIAHGLYSWVPNAVQDKLLEVCSRNLAPTGIAYVSYNTLPGWHMRGMIRDAMRYRAMQFTEPDKRIAQARAMLDFLARAVPDETSPYAQLLRAELELLRRAPDYYIFHEHLEELNEPVYFHQFMQHAARHGLQYLADADLANAPTTRFPMQVADAVHAMARDRIEEEQFGDFLVNRTFRQSLLTHADQPIDRTVTPQRVKDLWLASGARPSSAKPNLAEGAIERFCTPAGMCVNVPRSITKCALVTLAARWPAAVPFDDVLASAYSRLRPLAGKSPSEEEVNTLCSDLMYCFAAGIAELHAGDSPFRVEPGERPQASPLARHQSPRGPRISTLRHESIPVPEPIRALLPLLDGSRTIEEIGAAATAPGAAASGKFPNTAAVKDAIDQIARNALILR